MNRIETLSKYYFACSKCGKRASVTVINKEHPKRVSPPKGWTQRVEGKALFYTTLCSECK